MKTNIEQNIQRRILKRIRYVNTLAEAITAFKSGAAVVILPDDKSDDKKIILARNKFAFPIIKNNEIGWLTCEPTHLRQYKKRSLPTFVAPALLVKSLIDQTTQLKLSQVNNAEAEHKNPPKTISKADFIALFQKCAPRK